MAAFENEGKSSALLEIRPGDIEFFKIGDRIGEHVRLFQVHGNSVVIEVNGMPERISLQKSAWPMERIRLSSSGGRRKASGAAYDWSWLSNWEK